MLGRLLAIAALVGLAVLVVWITGTAGPTASDVVEPDPVASVSTPDTGDRDSATDLVEVTGPTTGEAVPVLGAAPPLERIEGWLQSDVTSLEELRGRVVIVHFWTFGCINCKRTIPNLQELAETHRDDDLTIVGVHAPEFDYERDPDAIAAAAEELGVTWPIALDTDKVNFHSWQEGRTAYWPRTYVIDREGRIRFDHIGEGAYDELNETVAVLLGES